ncbi:hypothetical protein AB0N19_36390, partial [Streptomyces sp. NPDC051132]
MRSRTGSAGPGPAPATGLPPPAERGATVIPDRVVARIAARAARTAQVQLRPGAGQPLSRLGLGPCDACPGA